MEVLSVLGQLCILWYIIGIIISLMIFVLSIHQRITIADLACLFVSAILGPLQIPEFVAVLKYFVQTRTILQTIIWRRK